MLKSSPEVFSFLKQSVLKEAARFFPSETAETAETAEKAAAEVLSLPMYPELQAVQQEEVVAAVAALQKEALALA